MVDEVTLYTAYQTGQGEHTLVFINSLGSDYRIWDAVVPHFSAYNILRYDLRGHGLSDCPPVPYTIQQNSDDLMLILDRYEVDTCVLIGISVGGMIAIDFTANHPDSVDALVLLDTFPKIGTDEMWNERIKTLREHGITHLGDAILARWFAPTYQEQNPHDYRIYNNMLTRMPVEGYTGMCEAIRDADLSAAATTINCPTLVLCGAQDQSTPTDLVSQLPNIIANAGYIEIPNAGHLPCVENPTATAKTIKTFLEDVL